MLPGLADNLGTIQAFSGQKSNISVKGLKGQYALRPLSSLGFIGGAFFFWCFFLNAFASVQMLILFLRDRWAIIGNLIGLNN